MSMRLLRRIVDVKEEEAGALLLSFVYFFALLAGWYIMRPLRDEMGVAGGVGKMPWLFTATFVTMLAVVPLYSWLAARIPRTRLLPLVYRFLISNLLVFFLLWRFGVGRGATARVYFVWTSVYNLFVVSTLWSVMADIWRGEQGKRLFGFVAAGGSAGGIAGSLFTVSLARALGPSTLVLVSAALLEVGARCVVRLSRRAPSAPRGEPLGGSILAGFSHALRAPYLRAICGQILFYTVTSTILYTLQAHVFAARLHDPATRTRIFALQDLTVNVGSVLVGAFLSGRLQAALGLLAALAVLPIVTFAGFSAVAVAPVVVVVSVFMVVRRIAHFGVDRPAREVLFTAVPREDKYKAKSFIDTVVYRGGDAIGGWTFAGLAGLAAPSAMVLSVLWVGLSLYLARAYAARQGASP